MENTKNTVILSTTGLSVHFEGLIALNNVDINVKEGEIHGLIGPNGAGKTTFTNTVSGLLRPDRGQIRFKDMIINTGANAFYIACSEEVAAKVVKELIDRCVMPNHIWLWASSMGPTFLKQTEGYNVCIKSVMEKPFLLTMQYPK
jgi:ABC-type cobalamin/Fe3+-siderophores transport system ATPase subunit